MKSKVLLVDDDSYVLSAYSRQLRGRFAVQTATSGAEGLELARENESFEVVVSDLKMPHMDGIEFLSRIKEVSPNTVRIMLTGNAALETAITAVNKGQIFRFITKPCSPQLLATTIEAAIEQHRLITAERVLLEKTLKGAVNVFTEVLSLVNPVAFSRAGRIRKIIQQMAAQLGVTGAWQFELAAMLSQIGCIVVPPETLDKVYAGAPLSEEELEVYNAHPNVTTTLIANIPRLETITQIITAQQNPELLGDSNTDINSANRVNLGGQLLRIATEIDQLQSQGHGRERILDYLKGSRLNFDFRLIQAFTKLHMGAAARILRSVTVDELTTDMTLNEDVYATTDVLLASKGQAVTYLLQGRLQLYARGVGVSEPIQVVVTTSATELAEA